MEFSFLLLPLEIQVEILRCPLDIQSFLALRGTSQTMRNQVNKWVEEITSRSQGPRLSSEIVMSLQRIKRISPYIWIEVRAISQLVILSRHPTLCYATLDVSNLVREQVSLQEVLDIFFQSKAISTSPQKECSFTFVEHRDRSFQIKLFDQGIAFSSYGYLTGLSNLYRYIASRFPLVKEYRGDVDLNINDLYRFTHLERIFFTFKTDTYREVIRRYFYLYEGNYEEMFIQALLETSATQYYIAIPKEERGSNSNYDYMINAMLETRRHPTSRPNFLYPHLGITTFFPINCSTTSFRRTQELFPSLTELKITLSSIEHNSTWIGSDLATSYLQSYPKILVVNNLRNPQDEVIYRRFFSPLIRDRLIFAAPDFVSL